MPRPPDTRDYPDPGDGAARAREAELTRAARAGDRKALTQLLEAHQARIFRTCLRVVGNEDAAADATQEALLRAVRSIASFDDRAQFSTWLTRIAINCCLTRARSEKLRRHASLDAPAGGFPASFDQRPTLGDSLAEREQAPLLRIQQNEEQARALEALSALDVEARTILLLRDGHDLEYDQIAEMLGVAIGTVKSRIFRARQALRDAIDKAEHPSDSSQTKHP